MKKTKKEFLYDLKDWYFETLGLGRWSGALPLKKAPKKSKKPVKQAAKKSKKPVKKAVKKSKKPAKKPV